jgi:hypothetical protein
LKPLATPGDPFGVKRHGWFGLCTYR